MNSTMVHSVPYHNRLVQDNNEGDINMLQLS